MRTKKTKPGRGAGKAIPPGERAMSFERFADVLHSLQNVIDWADDVRNCDACGLGAFIENKGSKADRAETILFMLPIAERILERQDAARAAVKGKK
jgi:hypothetical protein